MSKHSLLLLVGLLISSMGFSQQRVIFDTDMDSDVDDVGALAMLYNLHKQKEIDLLGVIVTSDDPYAPLCVSALNTYYGMEHLPVGFLEGQPVLTNHSRYTRKIAEEYPHPLSSWKEAPSATATYRKILSESPDHSIIILTVGHLSSLQKLLQSQPDEYSPLQGKDLVEAKVRKWYCMGGKFPHGKEANFSRPDPSSTVYCLNNWNKKVVFCGWEVGNLIITGDATLKKLSGKHPVYRAYELYNNFAGRASWDQIAVFLLSKQSREYFRIERRGYCHVELDGSNFWIPGKKSNHGYLILKENTSKSEISTLITALMLEDDVQ